MTEPLDPVATESPVSTESPTAEPEKHSSFLRELPILIAVALVLALLIKAFLVQAFYIPSGSMENTLRVGDRVLVNKLVYHTRSIHRGEIVVFNGKDTSFGDTPEFMRRRRAIRSRVSSDRSAARSASRHRVRRTSSSASSASAVTTSRVATRKVG